MQALQPVSIDKKVRMNVSRMNRRNVLQGLAALGGGSLLGPAMAQAGKTALDFKVGAVGGPAPAASHGPAQDSHAIMALLMTTFDRPDARLNTCPSESHTSGRTSRAVKLPPSAQAAMLGPCVVVVPPAHEIAPSTVTQRSV